jgi:serine protease inhibitor
MTTLRRPARLFLAATLLALPACEFLTGPRGGTPEPITELPRSLTPAELEVIRSSNVFAIDLLRQSVTARPAAANVFLSPLSASMALGMTMNGAAGETWTQMRDMLGFEGLDEAAINEAYRALIDLLLELDPGVTFGLGNSIWTRLGLSVVPDFYDRVREYFAAEVQELDFSDPATLAIINGWVEEATHGRIDEILDQIGTNDVMYLINAIYFLADWTEQFDRSRTEERPFTRADGSTVTIPLMSQTGEFRYFHAEDARGIELPYGGGAFTAVAVLPAEGETLAELVAGLDTERWADWMDRLDAREPDRAFVALPRFEIEYEQLMNGDLEALGMVDAFGPADFSRMVQGGGVWVDRVVQKTFLRVDEEGTEAAAATIVVMVESAPPEFVFDRPFLFTIRERLSGTVLFVGVIGDPAG